MATYRSSLTGSKLGKAFFFIIVLHPFLNLRLFLSFTSSCGELYKFHLYYSLFPGCPHSFLVSGDICCLLITFANSLFQDRYRQNVCLDLDTDHLTLIVFQKDALKKLILKKSQQMTTIVLKSFCVQRVITFRLIEINLVFTCVFIE